MPNNFIPKDQFKEALLMTAKQQNIEVGTPEFKQLFNDKLNLASKNGYVIEGYSGQQSYDTSAPNLQAPGGKVESIKPSIFTTPEGFSTQELEDKGVPQPKIEKPKDSTLLERSAGRGARAVEAAGKGKVLEAAGQGILSAGGVAATGVEKLGELVMGLIGAATSPIEAIRHAVTGEESDTAKKLRESRQALISSAIPDDLKNNLIKVADLIQNQPQEAKDALRIFADLAPFLNEGTGQLLKAGATKIGEKAVAGATAVKTGVDDLGQKLARAVKSTDDWYTKPVTKETPLVIGEKLATPEEVSALKEVAKETYFFDENQINAETSARLSKMVEDQNLAGSSLQRATSIPAGDSRKFALRFKKPLGVWWSEKTVDPKFKIGNADEITESTVNYLAEKNAIINDQFAKMTAQTYKNEVDRKVLQVMKENLGDSGFAESSFLEAKKIDDLIKKYETTGLTASESREVKQMFDYGYAPQMTKNVATPGGEVKQIKTWGEQLRKNAYEIAEQNGFENYPALSNEVAAAHTALQAIDNGTASSASKAALTAADTLLAAGGIWHPFTIGVLGAKKLMETGTFNAKLAELILKIKPPKSQAKMGLGDVGGAQFKLAEEVMADKVYLQNLQSKLADGKTDVGSILQEIDAHKWTGNVQGQVDEFLKTINKEVQSKTVEKVGERLSRPEFKRKAE